MKYARILSGFKIFRRPLSLCMRALLSWATIACPSAATAATAKLELGGDIAPRCAISSEKSDVQIGDVSSGGVGSAGSVGITCNLVNARATIQVTSTHRGMLRDGGSEILGYQMSWALAGQTILNDAAASRGEFTATYIAADPGVRQAGELRFTVSAASIGALPAGTYSDIVTINVFP